MMKIDIDKFDRCNVLVVGDLMVDEYIWGEVERISPEAPIPIVLVKSEDFTLGGSGNVVNNLIALGANVSVVGVIGQDKDGQRLLGRCDELGVDIGGIIPESGRCTTKKTRIIAANQNVLRIDNETTKVISDLTLEKVTRFIKDKMSSVDIVLVSDYDKGFVTVELLSRVIALAKKYKKKIIVDPRESNFSKYAGVSLLTPNKKEAGLAAGIEIIDQSSLFEAGNLILETVDIGKLLITCGKEGMVLFEGDKKPYKIETKAKQVYEVSGAGDTVLAVFGLAIASGISFKNSAFLANVAAGIVVGKVGTATVSNYEIKREIKWGKN